MRKFILVVLCILSVTILVARAEQVTLAELKRQVPERLQMSVTTDEGKTIAVDAPIVLPEGDVLPVVLVKRATFDLANLHQVFPLPEYLDGYAYEAPVSDDHPGAFALSPGIR